MDIRKLERRDVDALLELYTHYLSEDNVPPLAEQTKIQIWDAISRNPCVNYFVIERETMLIAACILTITPSFIRGGHAFGVIEHVVVHTNYRKMGYAQRILHHAIEYAWSHHCTEIMLLSGAHNHGAHQLYQKLKFDGERKKGFVLFHPQCTQNLR